MKHMSDSELKAWGALQATGHLAPISGLTLTIDSDEELFESPMHLASPPTSLVSSEKRCFRGIELQEARYAKYSRPPVIETSLPV